MTNSDKKDSVRGRMAETGEPFNVVRRKVEAAAAGHVPQDVYQLPDAGSRLTSEHSHAAAKGRSLSQYSHELTRRCRTMVTLPDTRQDSDVRIRTTTHWPDTFH